MNRFSLATLTAGLMVGLTAQGAITYVDAEEGLSGNTFATGGSLGDTTWVGPDSSNINATQWNRRAQAHVNGGVVFQGASTTTLVPELTTQITGLADGTYDVWAFYWDQVTNDGQDWVLSAGLTSGALTTYSSPGEPAVTGATTTGVTYAGDLTFDDTVSVIDSTLGGNNDQEQRLHGINLGQVVVTGGTIDVYVGNLLTTGGSNRAWYDGVGYELVPEPSSLALLGLGGLLVARRRRNA